MALANFNRENPFIILMQQNGHVIDRMMTDGMKRLILHSIVVIILNIVAMVIKPGLHTIYFSAFYTFFVILYNIDSYRKTLHNARNKDYDDIMYTDKYETVYVNNEMILDIIEQQNQAMGMLYQFRSVLVIEMIILILVITTIL